MTPAPVRAVIDVGTNTVLMVVGRWGEDGDLEILEDAHAIARLGKGVDARRRLAAASIDRVCGILRDYRSRAEALGAGSVIAYGTSAVRDAANRIDLIDQVRQQVGIELKVVAGGEEARLTWLGAGFRLPVPERFAVLDIGGGSTELAAGAAGRLLQSASVDIGAVRVTERCFGTLPPDPADRKKATAFIDAKLAQLFDYPDGLALVGVAGTATTLGAVDMEAKDSQAEAINGHFLGTDRVGELAEHLLGLDVEAIRAIPQIHPQRADIIAAGALILHRALLRFGRPGLTVSTRGIRYGLLLDS